MRLLPIPNNNSAPLGTSWGGTLFDELTAILDKNPNRKTYIFLDEVHDVEGWEKTVNSIRKRKNADVYITGSNSKMLSGELATYLTGRYVEFALTPFSYGEFLEASNSSRPEDRRAAATR